MPSPHHPAQVWTSGGPLRPGMQSCVGWGAALLFEPIDPLQRPPPAPGSLVQLRRGDREVRLRSGPGRWLRDVPVLDWRSIIGPEAPGKLFTQARHPPP